MPNFPTGSDFYDELAMDVRHEEIIAQRMRTWAGLRASRYEIGSHDTLLLNHYLFGTKHPDDCPMPINLWDETE